MTGHEKLVTLNSSGKFFSYFGTVTVYYVVFP
jgi:hypothetical protein